MKFVKDSETEGWYLDETRFYIGVHEFKDGEFFYDHLLEDGTLTLKEIVESVLGMVNIALEDAEKSSKE